MALPVAAGGQAAAAAAAGGVAAVPPLALPAAPNPSYFRQILDFVTTQVGIVTIQLQTFWTYMHREKPFKLEDYLTQFLEGGKYTQAELVKNIIKLSRSGDVKAQLLLPFAIDRQQSGQLAIALYKRAINLIPSYLDARAKDNESGMRQFKKSILANLSAYLLQRELTNRRRDTLTVYAAQIEFNRGSVSAAYSGFAGVSTAFTDPETTAAKEINKIFNALIATDVDEDVVDHKYGSIFYLTAAPGDMTGSPILNADELEISIEILAPTLSQMPEARKAEITPAVRDSPDRLINRINEYDAKFRSIIYKDSPTVTGLRGIINASGKTNFTKAVSSLTEDGQLAALTAAVSESGRAALASAGEVASFTGSAIATGGEAVVGGMGAAFDIYGQGIVPGSRRDGEDPRIYEGSAAAAAAGGRGMGMGAGAGGVDDAFGRYILGADGSKRYENGFVGYPDGRVVDQYGRVIYQGSAAAAAPAPASSRSSSSSSSSATMGHGVVGGWASDGPGGMSAAEVAAIADARAEGEAPSAGGGGGQMRKERFIKLIKGRTSLPPGLNVDTLATYLIRLKSKDQLEYLTKIGDMSKMNPDAFDALVRKAKLSGGYRRTRHRRSHTHRRRAHRVKVSRRRPRSSSRRR